jgi:shikimate O-hydroxycinnamoyltransferase
VLGTAIHHAAADASSAFHFFQTWSAFCKHGDRAAVAVELPCHDRTLLRARSPPTVHPDALLTLLPRLTLSDPDGPLATEVFTISRDQLASLKHLCGGASTFCAVSALLWQCACVARRLPPDSQVRMLFPADLRRRMRPPLPSHYFGNAVFRLCATGLAGDIGTVALGSVAARIKGAIERMDDELVRSAIDYYEYETAEVNKRRTPTGTLPQTDLNITSWLGRSQYDADFGWGTPQFMSRADSDRGGFVHLINDEGGGSATGDVRVLVTSAGNWAVPGRPGPSPSCFVPNGFGPRKPKQFLGRAVPARSVKTVAQPGPKPRRDFVGPCRPKPGPYI